MSCIEQILQRVRLGPQQVIDGSRLASDEERFYQARLCTSAALEETVDNPHKAEAEKVQHRQPGLKGSPETLVLPEGCQRHEFRLDNRQPIGEGFVQAGGRCLKALP